MSLKSKEVISLIRSIGNNLLLGRGIERSIYYSLLILPEIVEEKKDWIKMINIGTPHHSLFQSFMSATDDSSLARVWLLVSKAVLLSSSETGEKLITIAENLETNRKMIEKRNSMIKSQKYKIFFLGSITSFFLGVISALAPIFARFIGLVRGIEISQMALKIIPFSLLVIAISSTYFLNDLTNSAFTLKQFLLSNCLFAFAFLITKGLIFLLL